MTQLVFTLSNAIDNYEMQKSPNKSKLMLQLALLY